MTLQNYLSLSVFLLGLFILHASASSRWLSPERLQHLQAYRQYLEHDHWGSSATKRTSSHMLLVTQPWVRGPSLQYRRARGPGHVDGIMEENKESTVGTARRKERTGDTENQCDEVCGTCKHVVSIRVAALCPLECHMGGRSYEICKVVWSLYVNERNAQRSTDEFVVHTV